MNFYVRYKFSPCDIAAYFIADDIPRSRRNFVMEDFFENHRNEIMPPYHERFAAFRTAVADDIIAMETDPSVMSDVSKIKQDLGLPVTNDSEALSDRFGAYFRLIKLRILYSYK